MDPRPEAAWGHFPSGGENSKEGGRKGVQTYGSQQMHMLTGNRARSPRNRN